VKYHVFTMNRQVTPEIGRAIQLRMVNGDTGRPPGVGPYDYLDEAKENIRRSVRAQAAAAGGSAR
jgi:hypothetical protein